MQTETRKRIAGLTSKILNPFFVSLAMLLLLSFTSSSSTLDALRWAFISMTLSILPVFLVTVYLVRIGRLDTIFTKLRSPRINIYLPASICIAVGCLVLAYLRAPMILVLAFAAGLLTTVMFMGINLWWKISLHTALVTASVTMLVMLYGWMAVATILLVPLTVWARIEMEYHSLAQAIIGALLAALVTVVMFYPFVLT
ncbi:hypothetical protein ACFLTG_01130 [Chloroflexota bacterium]